MKYIIAVAALIGLASGANAQNQGPPTEPQVWVSASGVSVLRAQVRAGGLPGAVRYESTHAAAPAPNTWLESNLSEWGVPAGAGAVYLQCNFVSTPRAIPLPYVQGNGQVGEPPTYGVQLYFAAADDDTAVCPKDGTKYAVKLSLGLGGVTRVPFSLVVPVSPTGRIKHCLNRTFPTSIPAPKSGGPTLSYTCQPTLAFGGGGP